jgi:hypothetical protein
MTHCGCSRGWPGLGNGGQIIVPCDGSVQVLLERCVDLLRSPDPRVVQSPTILFSYTLQPR